MYRLQFSAAALLGAVVLSAALVSQPANADALIDWSFGSEAGTFTIAATPGGGGSIAPGTYTLLDFAVTAGPYAPLGSVSGGQYDPNAPEFGTIEPYSVVWNGSAITQFDKTNTGTGNTFNWFVFKSISDPGLDFLFADRLDSHLNQTNDPSYATLFNVSTTTIVDQGSLGGGPAAVPEPASIILLGFGVAGLSALRRRGTA